MIRRLFYSIIWFVSFIGLFSACEKDDICLEPTTPKLVIRFYDIEHPDLYKTVPDLQIVAEAISDTLKYLNKDSIAIPLDVNHNNCKFKFIFSANQDILEFTYQREDIFVSKICGYKNYFKNLSVGLYTDTDNWIKQIEILNNYIKSDTLAHVKIYH